MQLFNIVLFWIFFGALSAFFAKNKGRNPLTWFFIGVLLGVFGILLLFILPPPKSESGFSKAKKVPNVPVTIKNEAWNKYWYYLDTTHQQKGPFELSEFIKIWKQNDVGEQSYVWGEGMVEWKRLVELPELLVELKR